MAAPNFRISNATLTYDKKIIFSHLDIDLPAGKWIGLIGPSGVGKSALLRMIAGLTIPKEQSSANFNIDHTEPISQQVAYMAQTDLLLPWLTVLGNSTLGLKLRTQSREETKTAIEKAKSLLFEVGLAAAIDLYPHQLSGGMRQRVALVRTLMENKPLVLMDEPFSALDTITRYKLHDLAANLLQDKTVLFITHDPTEALRLSHLIYIMQGQPAKLKLIANLNGKTPRQLSDPELITLQVLLFQELSQAAGKAL